MHPLLYKFFNTERNKRNAMTIHCTTAEQRFALRELAAQYNSDFSDEYLLPDPATLYNHTYFFWDTHLLGGGCGFNSYLHPMGDSYEFDEFMTIIGGVPDQYQEADFNMEGIL